MLSAGPITKELVLLGGGHAHVEVVRSWPMHRVSGARVTLVSQHGIAPYSGMLPGLIADHYSRDEAHLELEALCRRSGVQFCQAEVTGVHLPERRILCAGRPPLRFDFLSINTGSTPRDDEVPGARDHALPVKPVSRFLDGWERWLAAVPSEPPDRRLRWMIVGGGAGGTELILAMHSRLSAMSGGRGSEFHLVTTSDAVPAGHAAAVQRRFAAILEAKGIRVHLRRRVLSVHADHVQCDGGEVLPFDALVWVTHAAAPGWIREAGLATDAAGFLSVNECLQSVSHPFVFGAGDVATVVDHPRAKSGVFAVRQGMPLAKNLAAALRGEPGEAHRPQRLFLNLIGTGDGRAVASYGGLACSGRWVWRVKDWIDRRWMRKYQAELPRVLPGVSSEEDGGSVRAGDPEEAMRCGGCGGKVDSEVLGRVLARLPSERKAGVFWGTGSREDVAAIEVPPGRMLVQSVDFFRTMVTDPYLFGRIAANHALSDLHGKAVVPHSALATVVLPWGAPEVMEEQLFQVLSGAMAQFADEEVALVGGHTAEGSELAAGFTVNGFSDATALVSKRGMKPGDRLILTKPLGTGVILAAAMRGYGRARWMDAAVASMVCSNAKAARCLVAHGVTACTDVTGFGLWGHLEEALRGSGVTARLDLGALPVLPGALEMAERGIRSSLAPANRERAKAGEGGLGQERRDARLDLLFDPQTAGGLVASIPGTSVASCLAALRDAGYPEAQCVGEVTDARPGGPVILAD